MSFDFDFDRSEVSDTTSSDASPDFAQNEAADLYLAFAQYKRLLDRTLVGDLGTLKVTTDDTLEDLGRLLGEHHEAMPQERLHMTAVLAKYSAGKAQANLNDHSIGLSEGVIAESHDEVQTDFSYALHSYEQDGFAVPMEPLADEYREALEDDLGVDPEEVSIFPDGIIRLPVIDGEAVPIDATDLKVVFDLGEQLSEGIPSTPSHYDEDEGLVASSDPMAEPSSDEASSDDGDEASSDDGDEEIEHVTADPVDPEEAANRDTPQIAENPKEVTRATVAEVRRQATDITSLRTIQTLLARESAEKSRTTVMRRLKERRNALRSDEDDEADDDPEADDGDEGDDPEADDDPEAERSFDLNQLSETEMSLASTMVDTGEVESIEEAAEMMGY